MGTPPRHDPRPFPWNPSLTANGVPPRQPSPYPRLDTAVRTRPPAFVRPAGIASHRKTTARSSLDWRLLVVVVLVGLVILLAGALLGSLWHELAEAHCGTQANVVATCKTPPEGDKAHGG